VIWAQLNPRWAVWLSITHIGSPVRQSGAEPQPCSAHAGLVMCVFSDQNGSYPQSSRYPWLFCAKPLKSFVFFFWPRAFAFPGYPDLTDTPETSNGIREHQANMYTQLCAGRVQKISHINIAIINGFVS